MSFILSVATGQFSHGKTSQTRSSSNSSASSNSHTNPPVVHPDHKQPQPSNTNIPVAYSQLTPEQALQIQQVSSACLPTVKKKKTGSIAPPHRYTGCGLDFVVRRPSLSA